MVPSFHSVITSHPLPPPLCPCLVTKLVFHIMKIHHKPLIILLADLLTWNFSYISERLRVHIENLKSCLRNSGAKKGFKKLKLPA